MSCPCKGARAPATTTTQRPSGKGRCIFCCRTRAPEAYDFFMGRVCDLLIFETAPFELRANEPLTQTNAPYPSSLGGKLGQPLLTVPTGENRSANLADR
jgi:hypothetical protein